MWSPNENVQMSPAEVDVCGRSDCGSDPRSAKSNQYDFLLKMSFVHLLASFLVRVFSRELTYAFYLLLQHSSLPLSHCPLDALDLFVLLPMLSDLLPKP